jgi:hypothetical protein
MALVVTIISHTMPAVILAFDLKAVALLVVGLQTMDEGWRAHGIKTPGIIQETT